MSTEKGVKLDEGKPRLDLVLGDFSNALWEVGKVGTFGANKYTDRGWREVDNGIERYLSALLRHYFKFKSGEEYDTESSLLHLSHMVWNSLAVLELYCKIKKARANPVDLDSLISGEPLTYKSISKMSPEEIDKTLDKLL